MPQVHFTAHLREVAPRGGFESAGKTVRDALADVFASHPKLRSYVLDDQGRVRRHVTVFVDGEMMDRSEALDVGLSPTSEVYVLQALSGG